MPVPRKSTHKLAYGVAAAFSVVLLCDRSANAYPLDRYARQVKRRGAVSCPKVQLEVYRGKTLRYHKPTRVFPGFRAKLERFEVIVKEVAIHVYGRPPRRIRHLGTYRCRRIAAYRHLLSEHAFGNAIDVAGFDFARLPRGAKLPEGLPTGLRRAFKVRMEQHWNAKGSVGRIHRRFLRQLARRLIDEKELFRVLLGPAWKGHHNHFHFDMAPYDLVAIFAEEAENRPR